MVKKKLKLLKSRKNSQRRRHFTSQPLSSSLPVGVQCTKTYARKARTSLDNLNEVQLCTLQRAEELQCSLDSDFPSFIKYMTPSIVSGGFWLGLPSEFCKLHLPKKDKMMTLIDENDEEYPSQYLVNKCGLSGGWRGFSIVHKLVEEDVLVFHLIKATKFKVHIIRAYGLAEVDDTLRLLDYVACKQQTDPAKRINTPKKRERKNLQPILQSKHSRNDSEAQLCITYPGSGVEYKDTKSPENFTIELNGLIIDSEISEYTRRKYYDLCSSQKASLHEHLLEGMNSKLVAGIIAETVDIADAIKSSMGSTSKVDFEIMDKSLMAFELMGMNVSFLRSRVQKLANRVCDPEMDKVLRMLGEAIVRQGHVEEETRIIEAKLAELKEVVRRLKAETKVLRVKVKIHELMFKVEVDAPW